MSFVKSLEDAKVVTKPWGFATIGEVSGVGEVWLNFKKGEGVGENSKEYAAKIVYIKAGTRSSLQLHKEKRETNYVVSGSAEIWFGDNPESLTKEIANPGEIFNVSPGLWHRVVAISDLVMFEASTPQVDDVIRFQDDAGRSDGRIQSEHGS